MSEESHNKAEDGTSPRPTKGKKRDRSASEERLINAGREIFSKHGFDGATTRMIAKKADVNESLIGRYFDGKEGLLVAIIEKFLEEMIHRELTYPPQDSLTQELALYAEDRLMVGCTHIDFVKIIFSQALVNRKFRKQVLETIPMQLDPRLIARVQKLAEDQKLKASVNVEEVCEDIDSYLGGVFFHDTILHETPANITLKRIQRFMKHFAKLFEKT
jgi:AcrR family transcriptional regulator